MSSNLIVPVAADKPEYSNKLPYVFALGEDGIIVCIKSVLGLPLDRFDNIYFRYSTCTWKNVRWNRIPWI